MFGRWFTTVRETESWVEGEGGSLKREVSIDIENSANTFNNALRRCGSSIFLMQPTPLESTFAIHFSTL